MGATQAIPFKVLGDGTAMYKSCCRMCHGGCGVLVSVKDGRVVKIEGDPESPLNRGRMCVKGVSSIEHLYNPKRLKWPLKRVGERGEGKWQRITWDEALDTIVNQIKRIQAESGIESIAVGTGTGRHHFDFVPRFANALGTPNWCEPGTAQCFMPRINASMMTYGDLPIVDYYGDVNPACVLVWGHHPVVSGSDGELQFRARDAMRKGSRLIVVDPRQTEMAKAADPWVQLRPGTDDALALAMINVIIAEELYDKEFVNRWTVGFEQLAERVRSCTPEWAEGITWVPADTIRYAARAFATTKPATIEWGAALEHTPNCFQTVRAIALLPALTGTIDIPGGWIFGSHGFYGPPIFADTLPEEIRRKRLGADRFKVLTGPRAPFPAAHIPSVLKAMRTGEPYPIRAFLVFGNNTLATYANTKQVYESLQKLEFFSVMDIYMTPTAELADIVLPAATWLELDEVAPFPIVANNVCLVEQKVVTYEEARPDEEVFVDLARRLGLERGTESIEEIYDYQLSPSGITFKELRTRGFVEAPIEYRKYERKGFATPSGKIELASSIMAEMGYDAVPYYQEPPESPLSTPEVAKEYPYVLTTGGRSPYFFHSEYRQVPSLRERHPEPRVELHPETAQKHGIAEGDWVWIETRRGRIKQKAKVTQGIDPRVVHVEHGWWFPERESPEYGIWESNANVLTDNSEPYDPAMGTYQLRALLCRVSKA